MTTPRRAIAAAALCTAALVADAGVVRIAPTRDNTLYETSIDNPQSNGSGDYCFVGVTGEPALRRTLIAFDLQSAIPAGATVLECSLTMHMSKTIAGPTDVSLHRALVYWGEGESDAPGEEGVGDNPAPGDATWYHTEYDTAFWANEGGDFDPTPAAATPVDGEGHYTWGPDPLLAADAQAWLDGTLANHGWLIRGDESQAVTAKRFDTRENPDPANHPALRIVYLPPCVADWDSNGVVDTRDVLGFLNEWAAAEVSADLNLDGIVNTMDILEFLNRWTARDCP